MAKKTKSKAVVDAERSIAQTGRLRADFAAAHEVAKAALARRDYASFDKAIRKETAIVAKQVKRTDEHLAASTVVAKRLDRVVRRTTKKR